MDFISRDFNLPENIFYFFNPNLDSLSFVLNWDTSDKFYSNLLDQYFAYVLDKPNEHSMVLTKPSDSTYFHNTIPAFDIKYIEHCFDLNDFPDPTKYIIKGSCPVTYSKQDIVDCWIHQTKSWSDLTPIPNDDNENENGKKTGVTHFCNEKNHHVSKTRLAYSRDEDIKIVKFIIKNNHAFDITGKKMWQNMERANICNIRSWQSMKERYLKYIKFDLMTESGKFPFLSKNDKELLLQGLNIDAKKEIFKSKYDEQIDK